MKESDDVPGLYPQPREKRQAISLSQLLCHTQAGKQIEGVKKFRRLHMIRHLPCHNFLDNQKGADSLLVIGNGGVGWLMTELGTSSRSINVLLLKMVPSARTQGVFSLLILEDKCDGVVGAYEHFFILQWCSRSYRGDLQPKQYSEVRTSVPFFLHFTAFAEQSLPQNALQLKQCSRTTHQFCFNFCCYFPVCWWLCGM